MADYWKYKIYSAVNAGGFCFLCGDIELRKITDHHVIGWANGVDITLPLCHKCHIAHNGRGRFHHLSIGKAVENKLISVFSG